MTDKQPRHRVLGVTTLVLMAAGCLLADGVSDALASDDPYHDLEAQIEFDQQAMQGFGLTDDWNLARALSATEPLRPASGPYYSVVLSNADKGCVVVTVVPGEVVLRAAVIQFEYGQDVRYRHSFSIDPRTYLSQVLFGSVIHESEVYVRGEPVVRAVHELLRSSLEDYRKGEHPDLEGLPWPDYAWFFEWRTSGGDRVYSESIVGRCQPAAAGVGEFMLALGGVDYESILRRWSYLVRAEPCRGESLPGGE